MKTFIKRLAAYIIDLFIISLISSCLMSIPYLNPTNNKYKAEYQKYNELYKNYTNFNLDLTTSYKDKKITTKEYNNLIKDNKTYQKELEKYYQNNKLTKKNYNKLKKEVDNKFQKEYKTIYYKINKYSTISNIIYIIIVILYTVVFNIITNGQTLGKKLLNLQIVNNDNKNSSVTPINYLIRSLILYNPIYYLALIIGPLFLNINNFYTWSLIWSNIKNYLEMLILIMIIIRIDKRGLHEILSNTKVITKNNINQEDIEIIKNDSSKKKSTKNKKIIIEESNKN